MEYGGRGHNDMYTARWNGGSWGPHYYHHERVQVWGSANDRGGKKLVPGKDMAICRYTYLLPDEMEGHEGLTITIMKGFRFEDRLTIEEAKSLYPGKDMAICRYTYLLPDEMEGHEGLTITIMKGFRFEDRLTIEEAKSLYQVRTWWYVDVYKWRVTRASLLPSWKGSDSRIG